MLDFINCQYGYVFSIIYAATYLISKCIYRIQKQKLKYLHMDADCDKPGEKKKIRYSRRRVKILITGVPTLLCMVHSYNNICSQNNLARWDIFGCLKWTNTEKIAKGILLSFYMNSVLYIGPIYQEIWNGNLRRKLAKLNFNKFRWDYFTKIVINPLVDEIIFRGLINNSINNDFNNDIVYILYSTLLYTIAKLLYFRFKYSSEYDINKLGLAFINSLLLGLYLSYVLVRTETLPTVIINHGFLNFMGVPNFGDLIKDDYYTNQQKQKTLKFYFYGFCAFIILCILVL